MQKIYRLYLPITLFYSVTFFQTFSQGTWTQVAGYGGGAVTEARAFAIGIKGYIVATPQLWEYDPSADVWTQMATFTGPNRLSGSAFAIGSKGYFGTGGGLNDFYEYDQPANTWTQVANFGGSGREGAVGIAVNGKGYIGTGGNYLADWWEYDPAANTWTQKANLAGPGRYHAGAFAIGGYGYICTGFNGTFYNDLWQYDPVTNSWNAKSNMPAAPRDRPVGLGMNGKGYIVSGWSGNMALPDAWEYESATDTWTQIANFGGSSRYNHCGFVIGSALFVGTGYASGALSDMWKYGNACGVQATATSSVCNASCDASATVIIPDTNAAVSYLWSTIPAQTSVTAFNLCGGSIYMVTVTDTAGCSSSYAVTIPQPSAITATFTSIPPACYGGQGQLCVFPSGGAGPPYCYSWPAGQTTPCITGATAGLYTVTICDSTGCTGSASAVLTQPTAIVLSLSHYDATCQTCANGNATANVIGGNGPYTFSWSTGQTGTAYIQNLLPGWYTCCVTDGNGCTVCDSVFVNYPGGIYDGTSSGLTIQPNPFNNHIVIKDVKPSSIRNIIITDEAGRMVNAEMTFSENQVYVNTEKLAGGVYFILITGKDFNSRNRLIKY